MTDLSRYDESRIEKLRAWLESKGVDVVQVGQDLTMPSPFKEAEKRKRDPGYPGDRKRRLWMTIMVGPTGKPSIVWQCWWSKGQGGKSKGGHSAYPLFMLTKVSSHEIHRMLDMDVDEATIKAETLEDQLMAIATQREREQDAVAKISRDPKSSRIPWPVPGSLVELFAGSPLTRGSEVMVQERGITEEVSRLYHLSMDCDNFQIAIPWYNNQGAFQLAQWWSGTGYRFPPKDGIHLQKEDCIFGMHLWQPHRPLILGEGCFSAMSILGQALGGSSLTSGQMAIIMSLMPKSIILAFDRDTAGISGMQGFTSWAEQSMRSTEVIIALPPVGYNDWNDVLKAMGFEKTLQTFAAVVARSKAMGSMMSLLEAYV